MSRDVDLPFERGQTFYGLGGVVDPLLGPGGINLEGKEFWGEVAGPDQYTTGAVSDPSGRKVRLKVVRNRSAINLLPRRLVRYAVGLTPNAGYPLGTGTDGYCYAATDIPAGYVDEQLPAAGVPPGDLFFIVMEGPTQGISATTGSISIASGAQVAFATGTSAVSADAGFIIALNESSTTVAQLQTKVGRAEANLAATVTTTSTIIPVVAYLSVA